MNNIEYLQRLHTDLMTIMDEIHRICTKHNLKYYLVGGTLLGAVRHKGFIPWDDDLDIAMPREDMQEFIRIAPGEFKKGFRLEWFSTIKEYYQYFPKVSMEGTMFVQENIKPGVQSGIFVDIFPLDLSPKYSEWLMERKKLIRRLSSCITIKASKRKSLKCTIFRIANFLMGSRFFFKKIAGILENVKAAGTTHYANFGSQYKLSKQTMPVEWYGNGTLLPFENREYIVPTHYMKVIESIYGKNYMQLPPENKRRCHYPEKVVFSDGIEVVFPKQINKVTIKEQES